MYEIIKMSLIFTSNTQDDYKEIDSTGRLLSGRIGIENPADYHNHLTSPLEVKPNSEIAVQSVKIERRQITELNEGAQLLYYFGKPLGTTFTLNDTSSRPALISVPRGTYDNDELATELQSQLNSACVSPAVKGNFTVTEKLDGTAFAGFTISASQNGPNDTDKALSLNTPLADFTHAVGSKVGDPHSTTSDNFTLSGGVFTRTGATGGTILDGKCCGIATDFPLSMNSTGEFMVDLRGASISDGEGGTHNTSWAIGLTRPTVQVNNDKSKYNNYGNAPLGFIYEKSKLPHYYDYVVKLDAGSVGEAGELRIYQGCYEMDSDGSAIPNSFKLHEIQYYGGAGQVGSIIGNASLNASTGGGVYQRLKFAIDGDEVKVYLKENYQDGGTELTLIDSGVNSNASRVFKPISEFTNALYPKICLAEGSLRITDFDTFSVSNLSYKYPTLTGADATDMSGGTYTVGNSPYANYVSYSKLMTDSLTIPHAVIGQQPCWFKRGTLFIKPPDSTGYGQMLAEDRTGTITFEGSNLNNGVDYDHTLVLEDTTPPNLEVGDYFSEMCNSARILGFPNITILDQTDGTVTADNKVAWTSTSTPEIKVNSAFVRLSNLNHRTYNSCKNSVSKMLYHIPRFTNDGRQFGDLFFEVGEKTYVDLNNTETFTLNQLQVQIVDKNERIVDDLVGDTIVVFHIKQK
jgi:hypothetical protein